MKRFATAILSISLIAMLAIGLSGCGSSAPKEKAPLHFIQFFDPDCPFCQAMAPTVASLKKEYEPRIDKFEIIDVSTTEGLAKADEFGVFITPTFVLLDADGNELDRVQGAATEENMIMFIDRGIADVSGTASGAREDIPTTGGTQRGSE